MLENRSFDHFFGFSKPDLNVNGLTGKEYNLENVKDKNSKKVWPGRPGCLKSNIAS